MCDKKAGLLLLLPRFQQFRLELCSGLGIKRSTGWTSGVNLAEMIEAIMTDSKKLLPCSAVFGGEFGYNDVACGALCRLGKNGVEEITLPLNNGQKAEMDAAVACQVSAPSGAKMMPRKPPMAASSE